jgi:hypothetical protein
MSNYFGPLGKEYCLYFYLMSIVFFVIMMLGLLGVIVTIVKNPKQVNMMFFVNAVMLLMNSVLAYFVNRLLHTMCANSIR